MQIESFLNVGKSGQGGRQKKTTTTKKESTSTKKESAAEKFYNNYRNASEEKRSLIDEILRPNIKDMSQGQLKILQPGQGGTGKAIVAEPNSKPSTGEVTIIQDKVYQDDVEASNIVEPDTSVAPWADKNGNPVVTPVNPADDFNTESAIKYTYKPGDTFGQVLLNLGLSNGSNLWGPNGDVAYYTKQLNDQGIRGNIPIGKTIRLLPRGTREKLQARRKQYTK